DGERLVRVVEEPREALGEALDVQWALSLELFDDDGRPVLLGRFGRLDTADGMVVAAHGGADVVPVHRDDDPVRAACTLGANRDAFADAEEGKLAESFAAGHSASAGLGKTRIVTPSIPTDAQVPVREVVRGHAVTVVRDLDTLRARRVQRDQYGGGVRVIGVGDEFRDGSGQPGVHAEPEMLDRVRVEGESEFSVHYAVPPGSISYVARPSWYRTVNAMRPLGADL